MEIGNDLYQCRGVSSPWPSFETPCGARLLRMRSGRVATQTISKRLHCIRPHAVERGPVGPRVSMHEGGPARYSAALPMAGKSDTPLSSATKSDSAGTYAGPSPVGPTRSALAAQHAIRGCRRGHTCGSHPTIAESLPSWAWVGVPPSGASASATPTALSSAASATVELGPEVEQSTMTRP